MDEGPDFAWLAVLTFGIAVWGGVIVYALTRYRTWQNRRQRSRPTD